MFKSVLQIRLNKSCFNLTSICSVQPKGKFYSTNLTKVTSKTNICLYGPPGSGKSAVSKKLGEMLKMPVYDVDDDHLEVDWNMTVAKKLEILGDNDFLKAEEGKENLI